MNSRLTGGCWNARSLAQVSRASTARMRRIRDSEPAQNGGRRRDAPKSCLPRTAVRIHFRRTDSPSAHTPRAVGAREACALPGGDEASFVTGAEIPVEGGLTAHGGVKSASDALRS